MGRNQQKVPITGRQTDRPVVDSHRSAESVRHGWFVAGAFLPLAELTDKHSGLLGLTSDALITRWIRMVSTIPHE